MPAPNKWFQVTAIQRIIYFQQKTERKGKKERKEKKKEEKKEEKKGVLGVNNKTIYYESKRGHHQAFIILTQSS